MSQSVSQGRAVIDRGSLPICPQITRTGAFSVIFNKMSMGFDMADTITLKYDGFSDKTVRSNVKMGIIAIKMLSFSFYKTPIKSVEYPARIELRILTK